MTGNDNRLGVRLFDEGWDELGSAPEPYAHDGSIGTVWIPTHFIKFVATSSTANQKSIGFA